MTDKEIAEALATIESLEDSSEKAILLAALVSEIFREAGFEPVIVGGSAIEIYTEGAYRSGDVDICFSGLPRPNLEERSQLMKERLKAQGSLRTWKVAGHFVDLLGELETVSEKSLKLLDTPLGEVVLMPIEELIAERVFIARGWQSPNEEAEACVRKLIATALTSDFSVDWKEAERIAALPVYDCLNHMIDLRVEVEKDLGID